MEPIIKSKKASLFFFISIACLYLGRVYQLPLFLLFFPFFSMLYLRLVSLKTGFLLLLLGSLAVILTSFSGISAHMFSSTGVFAVVMTVSTTIGLLPVFADRLLYKKVPAIPLVFIYPCSKVILEYVSSSDSPFGIWGSQASLVSGWFPLTGIVSLTGIWGLSFLLSLFSGLLVFLLENGIKNRQVKLLLSGYVIILFISCIYGFLRESKDRKNYTVRVAAILANDSLRAEPVERMYNHLINRKGMILSNDSVSYFHRSFSESNLDLFQQTRCAADSGARIIFWAEGNGVVLKKDEISIIDTAKTIARERNIYIGMAVEVFTTIEQKPVENKIILVQPDGSVAFQYYKHYPIGIEKDLMVTGDGNIPICNTPYGKIASVICFDTDFIAYARKVGQSRADILFAPSNDWKSIAELRGKITRYRALENGCTLVRPTSHGVTEMVDANGKLIKANNFFQNQERVIIANIPIRRMNSFYSFAGDFFPVLLFGLLLCVLLYYYKKNLFQRHLKAVAFLYLLLSAPFIITAQVKSVDTLPHLKSHKIKKGKTVLFPAISYAPETNIALGASVMHFYRSSADAKLSQISANMLYTLNNQFINEITASNYLKRNAYLIKAGLKMNKFPEKYFGIGNKTTDENAELISYQLIKTDFSILKKILNNTYLGLKYNYAKYYDIQSDRLSNSGLDTLTGNKNNSNSGLGISLVHDSRDNEINSTKGWYAEISSIWNNKKIGADENYYALDVDIRKYRQLRSGAVLAYQAVLNIKNGTVPFTQLSYLGGSSMMRGFYAGRYRDNDLLALQAEYRKKLFGKWGFTLFAGAGKVCHTADELGLYDLQHSLGFGFRRSLSKNNKVNLRIDVGYGNGNSNVYINIGEAF